jgi:hypothetical protein
MGDDFTETVRQTMRAITRQLDETEKRVRRETIDEACDALWKLFVELRDADALDHAEGVAIAHGRLLALRDR